ncbi:Do family serine endopeptidase [Cupriavidus necator]
MLSRTLPRAILGVTVIAAVVSGYPYLQRKAVAVNGTQTLSTRQEASPTTAATPLDFPTIVERYGPAVVNISVTSAERRHSLRVPDDINPDDPFFQFFRRFAPEFQWPPYNPRIIRGLGSGFIVSADGLILTNAHVVDGASQVKVRLTDRREFKAKVLGVDASSDVALIRIDARDLPTVSLGDSSRVRAGEPVLAIGSPYGFENTATAGIVSAVARTLPEDTYVPFIQTDVAVNPGNSGGPLFNRYGQVIGINAQIYSQTGGYQGLSFAIPINVATKVEIQLLAHGKVTRGRLGIGIQDVDQGLAKSFGLSRPAGALIDSVEPGSPAAIGGLRPGDVVTQADNQNIDRSADLATHIADLSPGTMTTLRLIRNREPVTVTVKVGALEGKSSAQAKSGSAADRLGLAVRPLNDDERRSSGLANGLVVEDVEGAAARAGIEPGDIILSLNGMPVASGEQLRALAAKAGDQVALLIIRDNARIFVPVELG